jgi:hypothetical protein
MSFTVFLGNLPVWVTKDDIKSWLNAENLVFDDVKVIRNPETQESKGFAFIDVISPCVAFNNHKGSTKSYDYVRDHRGDVVEADFVPPHDEIVADYPPGAREDVAMPDGSILRLRKLAHDYDPHDRVGALSYVQRKQDEGEVVTGLLYMDPDAADCHAILETVDVPLNALNEIEDIAIVVYDKNALRGYRARHAD